MASSSSRVPLTQNTAPIHEFACLYTHDIKRKRQKRWQDGFLRFHTFNKRVLVYDEPRSLIGETFLKDQDSLEDGDEIRLDRGVMVQVCEPKGIIQQDRAEILDKIRPQLQTTPAKPTRPSNFLNSSHNLSPRTSLAASLPSPALATAGSSGLLRPKALNAILGTSRGAHGRAALSKVSPYQERQEKELGDDRAAKRLRLSTAQELTPAPRPVPAPQAIPGPKSAPALQLEPALRPALAQQPKPAPVAQAAPAPQAASIQRPVPAPRPAPVPISRNYGTTEPAERDGKVTPRERSPSLNSSLSIVASRPQTVAVDLTLSSEPDADPKPRPVRAKASKSLTATTMVPKPARQSDKLPDTVPHTASPPPQTSNLKRPALQPKGPVTANHPRPDPEKALDPGPEPEVIPEYRKTLQMIANDKENMTKLRITATKKKGLMYRRVVDQRTVSKEQTRQPPKPPLADSRRGKSLVTEDEGFDDDPAISPPVPQELAQAPMIKETSHQKANASTVLPTPHGQIPKKSPTPGQSDDDDAFETLDEIIKAKEIETRALEQARNLIQEVNDEPQMETVSPMQNDKQFTLNLPALSQSTIEALQAFDVPLVRNPPVPDPSPKIINPDPTQEDQSSPKRNTGTIPLTETVTDNNTTNTLPNNVPRIPPLGPPTPPPPDPQEPSIQTAQPPPNQPSIPVPTAHPPNPSPTRRRSPLKKCLTDPKPPTVHPPAPLLRTSTDLAAAQISFQGVQIFAAEDDASRGPWSKEAFDLFDFRGGETWSMDGGPTLAGFEQDDGGEGKGGGGEGKGKGGGGSRGALVERQRELVRLAKKACRGMGGGGRWREEGYGVGVVDEYDYVDRSTYA